MKVSIHFSTAPSPASIGKEVVLHGLELSTALTISAALQGLEHADLHSLIVIGESHGWSSGLPAQDMQTGPKGWFNHLLPPRVVPAAPPVQ